MTHFKKECGMEYNRLLRILKNKKDYSNNEYKSAALTAKIYIKELTDALGKAKTKKECGSWILKK